MPLAVAFGFTEMLAYVVLPRQRVARRRRQPDPVQPVVVAGAAADRGPGRAREPDAGRQGVVHGRTAHHDATGAGVDEDAVRRGRSRHLFCFPLIEDDDGRADADFEPVRVIELLQRLVVHEEHRVAIGLDAGLEANRPAARAVVRDRAAALHQRAVTMLTADPEAGFGDLREDEDRGRFCAECLGGGHARIERCQRGLRIPGDFGFVVGDRRGSSDNDQCRDCADQGCP